LQKKNKKILSGLGIAALVLAFSVLFHSVNLLNSLNLLLSNHLYHEREISDEIIIVGIDDKSMLSENEGGLGDVSAWTPATYSKVLENIEKDNGSQILLDIFFGRTTGTSADQILVSTFSKHENIYLIKYPTGEVNFNGESFEYQNQIEPVELFASNVKLGHANLIDDEDGSNENTVYAVPYKISVNAVAEKHLDFKILEDYLGVEVNPQIEEGQMIINYAKQTYNFTRVSFSDVYNGNFDSGTFENKIVLIGPYAASLQDRFYTPIDQKKPMPGIEIQANIIQTVLDEAYLAHQSTMGFALFTGLITFASVAAFLFLPILWGSAVLVIEMIGFPFIAQIAFNMGIILDLIWPVFAIFTAYLAVLAYRNFTEFREKRKLRSAFAHYVSKDLIENVISNPDALKLGGERRNISVLFLDIENFTTLSEKLEATQVVEVINNYFDALSNLIMDLQGTVDKFEGDAIMALFGAPIPSEDHAEKACHAALKIREKMAELNKISGFNLNVRVGVATGEAVVGNMGSKERFDYTAMGDTVNTASRLEGINKFYSTRILVTEGSYNSVKDKFSFREIDTICPKGKNDALKIYELLGLADGITEEGKAVVATWVEALNAYRAGNWDAAVAKIHDVQLKLPEDGPSKTFLERIEEMKKSPREGWDGVWKFLEK
jgi:adenylate cyclase